ncbi:MAG: FtsX-like permease family protein [Lachnospiraceae bacterium]|nr:FtsX-like permease family protein [Lachnospiraceae bacterium]
MFLRILKNDLRRKKSMNIILLIFVILSAMFASSSTYNMLAVYGGIDRFFERSEMTDYVILTLNSNGEDPTEELVKSADSVMSFKKENLIFYSAADMKKDGKKYVSFENPGVIVSEKGMKLNYFNKDNEVIKEIPQGHVYVGGLLRTLDGVKLGDRIDITIENRTVSVTIDGFMKDALLGSPFLSNPRMLMSDEDYETLLGADNIAAHQGGIYYINTDDMTALKKDVAGVNNSLFSADAGTVKITFMLDMLTAALLLIVSVCLILIAFTMLSFTIRFTLSEDFREIGVMKAVGLKNRSIRGMYMIKYLCISIVGALIGYFASIPFGNVLMASVSERLLLESSEGTEVGIISACAVVIIVLWFCYFCTRRIKKLSPIDAVRSGETGERYKAKSVMNLSKSRLGSNLFLGINDVLGKPRQYMSMIVTFTICLLLVMMLATAANTLMSEKLIYLFGTTESDAYFNSTEKIMETMGNNDETILPKILKEIEDTLAKNGMPADTHVELNYQIPVRFGDTGIQVLMQQCTETKTTDYVYNEGLAPMYPNEVAFTPQILEELGAKIGDKVMMTVNGEESEYTISATFVSLNQLGKVGRLHQDVKMKSGDAASGFAFQIDFRDNPDKEEAAARIERMKEIFDTDKIYDAAEFVDNCTNSASTLIMAKNMVLIIALLIAILITVLMERSFLSKESSEIALMKAIGFKTRSVSAQHTFRFVIASIISTILAIALSRPFTKMVCDQIFGVMGAGSGIEYKINGPELFALYPAILAVVVSLTAWLTSLYAKTIKADMIGNIE